MCDATEFEEKLTINYVLDQIERITSGNEYIHNALEQLAAMPKSDPGDIAGQEKAKAIGDIVRCRETTYQQALGLYEKMYDNLINAEARKVEIIKSAFSEQIEKINKCDLNKEDKYAAIGDVTYQIKELMDKLLFPGTVDKAKERVVAEMSYIIKSPDTDAVAKTQAAEVLRSYMEWQTTD